MKTINMWLESPKKVGQIELAEDEITYNLEDFLNDLIYNGFDTFKLYSSVTNSGPIGLIAKVENGEIIEMNIDEYSQIIGEDIDITDLYNNEYDSWEVFDLNENNGAENSNYFETEDEAKKEYNRLVNKYHKNEDALHTIILLHNGEVIEKFNYENTGIKDTSTYDADMIYVEKMVKTMLDKGMDKDTIIDVLVSSGLTEEQAKSLLPINTKDTCKDTDDVFIKDDDYDKAQVKAYKMLIGPKKPFAVIYAYSQGKNKVLLNPPLIKKSKEEVQDFLNGFRRGKEGTKITVDVFYASQIRSIKESLISRGLIKDNTVKDAKIPEVDDWVIEEARKIVMAGYDDKEDLLDKIQDLSDDLTPKNVLDIYKYLKRTMKISDSNPAKNKKYNRYGPHECHLITDSLKDVDNNLTTGISYYKKIRELLSKALGDDASGADYWNYKGASDVGSTIDMYSWIAKTFSKQDYINKPTKLLNQEREKFETILNNICNEVGCKWEPGKKGASSGSSSWFHDGSDFKKDKQYDDWCLADYRINLPANITKWKSDDNRKHVLLYNTDITGEDLFTSITTSELIDKLSRIVGKRNLTKVDSNTLVVSDVLDKHYDKVVKLLNDNHINYYEDPEFENVSNQAIFIINISILFKDSKTVKSTNDKWQAGDETVLTPNMIEYKYMKAVCDKLNELSNGKVQYQMEDVYLDAGLDWMWTTIVQTGGWTNVQILNPKVWLDIVNGKPTDEVVKDIRQGEYFSE